MTEQELITRTNLCDEL